MKNSVDEQLSFNFDLTSRDMMPEDITVDELLYVLQNHSDSDLARTYYFKKIKEERTNK
jgi:hypothetical protein